MVMSMGLMIIIIEALDEDFAQGFPEAREITTHCVAPMY